MRLTSLTRKLLRDLWLIRGQALAIAAVIGAGVALFVTMMSTLDSLNLTLTTYYDRYRFGDVFASCKRAPMSLGQDIARLPGVSSIELRVVADVTIDMPGLSDPVTGHFIGVPDDRRPALCDLFVRQGRYLEPGRRDEVLVSERFAVLHGLRPGDRLVATINGRRRALQIVGIAMSPEFIYTIRPGDVLPDDARYGIVWMDRRALAAAFDMEGGFNSVVVKLHRRGSAAEVQAGLDRLLEPYGGFGAIPRDLQVSNWYLANELKQLVTMGTFIPAVFLLVAAFLVNVVLSRIVSVQREQVAALKAIGYDNRAIGLHYVSWSLLIALAGCVMGIGAGAWLGAGMTRMYTDFFAFPLLLYRLDILTLLEAVAIGLTTAAAGAILSVQRAVSLPPAEAMRPPAPERYEPSVVERAGIGRWLSQPARMIARNLQRHPGRALVSSIGIALACALLVLGSFSMDAFDLIIDTQFNVAQRYDVMVTFVEPRSSRALFEIERLPGVLSAEGTRGLPVRLCAGIRQRYAPINGLVRGSDLYRVADARQKIIEPPIEGLLLSTTLARQLGVSAGDRVIVEVLEDDRPVHTLPVTATADDLLGASAYMEIGALHRLMREGQTLSGAFISVDPAEREALFRRLKRLPMVGAVVLKEAALKSFNDTMAEMVNQMQAIDVFFAAVIAFGVVYNSARISLSERSRELATLRVIGFARSEVSYILLGELAVLSLVAIPAGLGIGRLFAWAMVRSFDTDVFRIPLVIAPSTYAFAAGTIIAATVVSALIVRRQVDRLDLVAVLKTRE